MNMYTINQEAYILLTTIYGGILIGFIYELYKLLRHFLKPKKFATNLQDGIFWTIITAVAFYVLILSNQGQLRFYNFIGFIVGALLFHYILSKPVNKSLVFLCTIIKDFFYNMWNLAIYPFRVAYCLSEVPYSYCKKKTKPVYYKTKRILNLPKRMLNETKRAVGRYFKKK